MPRLSLKIKTALSIYGITLAIIVIGVFWGFSSFTYLMRETIGKEHYQIALRTAGTISDLLNDELRDLERYVNGPLYIDAVRASNLKYASMTPQGIAAYMKEQDALWAKTPAEELGQYLATPISQRLSNLTKQEFEFSEIFITDRFGGLVVASNKTSDFYQADEKWWQDAFSFGTGRRVIENIEYDTSSGEWAMPLCVPLRDNSEKVIGIIKGVLKTKTLFQPLSRIQIGRTGIGKLIDDKGDVLYGGAVASNDTRVKSRDLKALMPNGNQWVVLPKDRPNHTDTFLSAAQVVNPILDRSGIALTVVIEEAADEVFAPLATMIKQLIIFIIVLSLIGLPLGFVVAGHFVKPIAALRKAAISVGAGDLEYKIQIKTGDEIEDLANSFARMLEDLNRTMVSKSFLDHVMDSMTDSLIVAGIDNKIRMVNQAALTLLGYSQDELMGKEAGVLFVSDIPSSKDFVPTQLFHENKIVNYKTHHRAKNGKIIPVLLSGAIMKGESGQECGVVYVAKDITDLKIMENALLLSEKKLRAIFDQTFQFIGLLKTDGTMLDINGSALELIQAKKEDVVGKPFWTTPWWTHSTELQAKLRAAIIRAASGEFIRFEATHNDPYGTLHYVDFSLKPVHDENGNVHLLIPEGRDITKIKEAENKLRRIADEWKTTFDSVDDMISVHDNDHKIIRVNKAFSRFFNKPAEELLGKLCYEVVHGKSQFIANCPNMLAMATGRPQQTEYYDQTLGLWLEVSIFPIFDEKGEPNGTVHIIKDITERKKIESAQRLAELGKLVADMAHEVNNPLMIISGNAQLCLMSNIQDKELSHNLQVIFEESKRAGGIIQRLLKFSKPSEGQMKDIDVNVCLETTINLIEHQFSLSNIKFIRNFDTKLPYVNADQDELKEVFMNLLNNAKDAMTGSGYILINTYMQNDFVTVEIKDNGAGIPEHIKNRIFQPFFTTKEKGTGLGLSVCYGIVKAHRGKMDFESSVDLGTTFRIQLPASGGLGNV